MATEKAAQGFGAKFMHWYESYQGKNIVNIVYSVGASVVIIGALFKILHWPGTYMNFNVAPFVWHTCCHGKMFEWCSIIEMTTSSPEPTLAMP